MRIYVCGRENKNEILGYRNTISPVRLGNSADSIYCIIYIHMQHIQAFARINPADRIRKSFSLEFHSTNSVPPKIFFTDEIFPWHRPLERTVQGFSKNPVLENPIRKTDLPKKFLAQIPFPLSYFKKLFPKKFFHSSNLKKSWVALVGTWRNRAQWREKPMHSELPQIFCPCSRSKNCSRKSFPEIAFACDFPERLRKGHISSAPSSIRQPSPS